MKTGIAYGAAAGVMAAGAGFTAKIALSGELSRRLALQLDYYCHSDWVINNYHFNHWLSIMNGQCYTRH